MPDLPTCVLPERGELVTHAPVSKLSHAPHLVASGVVEYKEFLQIMTNTLQKFHEQKQEEAIEECTHQLPFDLMAAQFRRMKYMEGILSGDKESIRELARLSDKQSKAFLMAQREEENGALHVSHEPEAANTEPHLPRHSNLHQQRRGSQRS